MGKFRKIELVNINGFELQKHGTLSTKEESWIEMQIQAPKNAMQEAALELGEWIAANEGKTPQEAMAVVLSLDTMKPAEQMAVLAQYKKALPGAVETIQNYPKLQKELPAKIATWALNKRLPSGWIAENRNELREDLGIDATGGEWLPEWTEDIGADTVQSIYEFILKERNGWLTVAASFLPPDIEDEEEQTLGEDLPLAELGSPPTGENDGPPLKLPELTIQSLTGTDGTNAPAIS